MVSPLKLDAYDIIICGGGTAGLVLANRLSAIPSLNILVLEAGENANDDFRISTPGLFPLTIGDQERDWGYVSEPSPGMNNRKIGYPRGRCLGGSSCLNLMAVIFPSRACLDMWQDLGNDGWGWEGMQKYYRRFQRHCPTNDEAAQALGMEVLGQETTFMDGPICTSYPGDPDPIQKAWMDTWKGLGKQLNGDPLSGDSIGGYTSAASVDPIKRERSHAGVGYYAPIAERKNLHVVTSALIDTVELDASNPDNVVATGVVFSHKGTTYTAKASREVILSAGTIASPAILERSGIGSKDLCDQLGIKNVIDNANVGENFQDHLMVSINYEVNDGIPTADVMRDPKVAQALVEMYQTSKSGPLGNGAGYSFAYTPLVNFMEPRFSGDDAHQMLEKHLPRHCEKKDAFHSKYESFVRSILSDPTQASSTLCICAVQIDTRRAEDAKDMFATIHKPENYVSILPQLAHPLSRGSIHIKSADPNAHPVIKNNFCDHPLDVEVMARHLMQTEHFARSPPLCNILKTDGKRFPEDLDALTLENAMELVKAAGTSNAHPMGTCAMKSREMGGVVDSRLKLYGTKNLRVCDASIFPIMVRGNIQSSVYAVAEKASDILKEDLGCL